MSNKFVRAKTIKPTLKDEIKGKSVLFIDTPKKCEECILCKKMEDGCYYCMATNKIIVDKTLKNILLCPLITEEELNTKTRKPNIWDKIKGSFNCIIWMLESLLKGNIEEFKFGYVLLKETIAGKFEIVVKEK